MRGQPQGLSNEVQAIPSNRLIAVFAGARGDSGRKEARKDCVSEKKPIELRYEAATIPAALATQKKDPCLCLTDLQKV